jgi:hypothetical protein
MIGLLELIASPIAGLAPLQYERQKLNPQTKDRAA